MNAALTLFCETQTEGSVKVLRVKIRTTHCPDRHFSNSASQTSQTSQTPKQRFITNVTETRGKRRDSGTPVLHRTPRTPLVLHCTPPVLCLYSTVLRLYSACTPPVLRSTGVSPFPP
jgi:hypothetical protein